MTTENNALEFAIFPVWSKIKSISGQSKAKMREQGLDPDLIYAAGMVITELTENAFKYGMSLPGRDEIAIRFEIQDNTIIITTSNGLRCIDDFDNAARSIDKIKASDNPEALYIGRLTELMENPKGNVSQLGFFRIAYEGEFDLDYSCDKEVLVIKATRSF